MKEPRVIKGSKDVIGRWAVVPFPEDDGGAVTAAQINALRVKVGCECATAHKDDSTQNWFWHLCKRHGTPDAAQRPEPKARKK